MSAIRHVQAEEIADPTPGLLPIEDQMSDRKEEDKVQPQLVMWPPIYSGSPAFQTFVYDHELGISKNALRFWLSLLCPSTYQKIFSAELLLRNTHDAWGDLITKRVSSSNSSAIARGAFHWFSVLVIGFALEVEENHKKQVGYVF